MHQLNVLTKPRIVAFVDIGNSKSTITIGKYEKDSGQIRGKVLSHSSDENLGGRDLDWSIFEKLNQEFLKDGGCNLKE